MANGGYDDGYRNCPCFWGEEPGSYVKLLLNRVESFKGLRFLDAGCGEGKNAAFISLNQGIVEAVDISGFALQNRTTLWTKSSLITWREGDIREMELVPESFDVIIAYGLLHCFSSSAEIEEVLRKFQKATRIGGYNVICAFNERHQELDAHPGFTPTLLSHDQYMHAYSNDWDIISCSDSDLVETHPHNNIQHSHSMTRLLVRKADK